MTDLIKIMHCGCTYNVNGNSTGISKDIFGDGSDGNCTIEYDASTFGNVFMEAKEYNFCNLTIDSGVKLRFCGNGVPVLRVKNCFVNNGDILLRNPIISSTVSYKVPYLGKTIRTRGNNLYDSALSWANVLTEDNFKYCCVASGGKTEYPAGCSSCMSQGGYGGNLCTCASSSSGTQYITTGGSSSYANASGGGGGGYYYDECSPIYVYYGCNGCDAPSDGVGGDGGYGYCNGGGGGFGYCQGGNGGNTCGSNCSCGGAGGNSIIGNGGNGGNGDFPGNGGCSIYGNGGTSGDYHCYSRKCCSTCGGSSFYGNGGTGYYCGGYSLFGKGGDGCKIAGIGLEGGIGCYSRVWGGVHGLGLFAKDLNNQGMINGKGGDTCSGTCRGEGSDGAEVYMVYENLTNLGNICVREGYGSTNGYSGFVCMHQI